MPPGGKVLFFMEGINIMALRNQPYLPLYVQDYLTDEKLNECSASAQGIYIKIMCIMHKSTEYGTILLKQKDQQKESNRLNFAIKLARLLPFTMEEIHAAINELTDEEVLTIEDNKMLQKRMVKDNEVSQVRSEAGKKGGFATNLATAKPKAKPKANTEGEYESENESKDEDEIVIFPFDSEDFKKWWGIWKEYKKKEHNFKYKSHISEQAASKELANLSNGNESTALKIIERSISKGWKGFFPLENNKNQELEDYAEELKQRLKS